MKRGRRDADLALVSNEIATLTNQSTDPDLFEAYKILLAAPEVILGMLRDKPLRLINLMRTSKTLMEVLGQIPGLWIVLLESVLLQETWDDYYVTIYPFVMIQHHRECLLLSKFADTLRRVQVLPMEHSTPDIFLPDKAHVQRAISLDALYMDSHFRGAPLRRFGIVAHTTVVQLISEVVLLSKAAEPWINYGFVGSPIAWLGNAREDELWRWVQDMDTRDFILVMLSKDGDAEPHLKAGALFRYDEKFIRNWITTAGDAVARVSHTPLGEDPDEWYDIEVRAETAEGEKSTQFVPFAVAQLMDDIKSRVEQLVWLEKQERTATYDPLDLDPTPVVALDETFVLAYRQMLYDPITGIYNTPEKQKALLFHELLQISRNWSKESVIDKYGEPFNFAFCANCEDATCLVSERLGLPFCSDACQKAHANK